MTTRIVPVVRGRVVPGGAGVRSAALAAGLAALVALPAGSGLAAEALYWTAMDEYPKHSIRKSGLDGSNLEDVVTGIEDSLGGLAVDSRAGKLYWIENGAATRRIVRAGLDGREREVVLATGAARLRGRPHRSRWARLRGVCLLLPLSRRASPLPGRAGGARVDEAAGRDRRPHSRSP